MVVFRFSILVGVLSSKGWALCPSSVLMKNLCISLPWNIIGGLYGFQTLGLCLWVLSCACDLTIPVMASSGSQYISFWLEGSARDLYIL